MKNSFRVYWRDIKRIARVPAAWVIVFGLTALPALYTWVNVIGFWNPYNNTSGIVISVANNDAGGTNELTGDINVGDLVEKALKDNDQLGWTFEDEDTALSHVKSGESYAAIIIPEDFSSNLLTILSGDFHQPKLEYYVNEKANAVAPKVTDVGANTVDQEINDTFVSTVSEVVAQDITDAASKANSGVQKADQKTKNALEEASSKIGTAQDKITGLMGDIDNARQDVTTVKSSILAITDDVASIGRSVQTMNSVLLDASQTVGNLTAATGTAMDTASQNITQAATATSSIAQKSNQQMDSVSAAASEGISQTQGVIDSEQTILDGLKNSPYASNDDVKKQIDRLQETIDDSNQSLDTLKLLQQQIDQGVDDTTQLVTDASTATTSSVATVDALRSTISTSTIPSLNSSINQLSMSVGGLASIATTQDREVTMLLTVLDQLDSTLSQLNDTLQTTNDSLTTLKSDFDEASTDVGILTNSATWKRMINAMNLDSGKIANFMSSPTEITTEKLYPVATYGSSMAPLFTCLTMWIGSIMLVVILRLEVDDEGIDNLTVHQRYMGRWMLMATLSVMQALIVSIGECVLHVQMVSPSMFILTTIIMGLVYLSVVYSLSVCFMHIGIGISIICVFLQIPGASGLYPIEMMPSFFRKLYPFFPFTYGNRMLRETIGGFYKTTYVVSLCKLLLFAVVAFILGLALRPFLTNVTRVFYDEIAETHLMMGEAAETPARRYRLSQVISALSSKEEYRAEIMAKAARYEIMYPRLKHGALICGFVIPAALAVLSAVNSDKKVVILALWVIWMLLIIGFLLTIELLRDSIQRQVLLLDVSEEELRTMVAKHARTVLRPKLKKESDDESGDAPLAPVLNKITEVLEERVQQQDEKIETKLAERFIAPKEEEQPGTTYYPDGVVQDSSGSVVKRFGARADDTPTQELPSVTGTAPRAATDGGTNSDGTGASTEITGGGSDTDTETGTGTGGGNDTASALDTIDTADTDTTDTDTTDTDTTDTTDTTTEEDER